MRPRARARARCTRLPFGRIRPPFLLPTTAKHCHRRQSTLLRVPLLLSGANQEEVAVAFTSLLDTHVETVNSFYMERIEEGVIILHALHQHGEQIRAGIAKPDLRSACQRSLVSFHFQLLVLQNYVALNFTAITKVLKKFEKKFEMLIKDEYIGAIVELPFYRCDALGACAGGVERAEAGAPGERLAGTRLHGRSSHAPCAHLCAWQATWWRRQSGNSRRWRA